MWTFLHQFYNDECCNKTKTSIQDWQQYHSSQKKKKLHNVEVYYNLIKNKKKHTKKPKNHNKNNHTYLQYFGICNVVTNSVVYTGSKMPPQIVMVYSEMHSIRLILPLSKWVTALRKIPPTMSFLSLTGSKEYSYL